MAQAIPGQDPVATAPRFRNWATPNTFLLPRPKLLQAYRGVSIILARRVALPRLYGPRGRISLEGKTNETSENSPCDSA